MKPTKTPLPSRQPSFRLLSLPLELRLQIFTCAKALPRQDHLNLLCCSSRIHDEAQESFLSRSLSFMNQRDLAFSMSHDDNRCCQHSRDLTLALTDMDPAKMQTIMFQLLSDAPKSKLQRPYVMESQFVTSALHCFRDLTSFSLIENDESRHTPAPSILSNSVISWLLGRHTQLSRLRIDASNVSLEPLSKLTALRSLSVNAYSGTPASKLSTILGALSSLEHLEITCPTRQALYFRPAQMHKSVNADVIRNIPALKSLHIHDRGWRADVLAPYITSDILGAIRGRHSATLTELSIIATNNLGREVEDEIDLTLQSMRRVHTLTLILFSFPNSTLRSMPPTVWSLKCMVTTDIEARRVPRMLEASRMKVLRKIDIIISGAGMPLPASMLQSGPRGSWDITFGYWGGDDRMQPRKHGRIHPAGFDA
jgi:hypothetical protein